MSGGVDSAVAAARAVECGHEVVGVHLALSAKPGTLRTGARGCCTVEDARDARRAADVLGIPFYVWDFAERFTEDVIEDFVAEYAAGRTPNPCVRCNERIKFAALLDKAIGLGFDAVCTGHYARLSVVDGVPELRRSADPDKDQSYVLASLRADQLRHAMFPLGDSTKPAVRAGGRRARAGGRGEAGQPRHLLHPGRRHAGVPDQDSSACAPVRSSTTRPARCSARTRACTGSPSASGTASAWTAPASDGRPRYVLSLEPVSGNVRVGPADRLAVTEITGIRPVWPSGARFDRGRVRGRRCARTVVSRPRRRPWPVTSW